MGTLPGMPPQTRKQTEPTPAPTTTVDTTTNPAGAPEGTDHGHQGDGSTPSAPATPEQPQAGDLGATTPTQGDEPPAGDLTGLGDPLATLGAYLTTHYPQDADTEEHPALVAVRVLTRLGAHTTQGARCTAPYCNLPALHQSEHGWVHVEPR